MKVTKRDGRVVEFDDRKIENAILRAFESAKESPAPVRRLTDDVVRRIRESGKDPIHIEEIQDIVEDVLIHDGFTDIAKRYIRYREKRANARRLLRQVGVVDDLKIGANAATVLKRYLLKNESGEIIETPSQLFRRVAGAIAGVERMYDPEVDVRTYADLYYSIMVSMEFLPNSPTLFNAGTEIGQCSACFVLPIDDDIDAIFTSLKHMAKVQKSGGGTGFSFSRLRPAGSRVGTTGGVASGPVSFMRVYDTATDVIKQGGKRRGANMAILRCDHPDIMEFISCKADKQAFRNFNISVAVTDRFMEALREDGEIELISPNTGEVQKRVRARTIFDAIVHNAWSTGDPGIVFIDTINREHPLVGTQIEATNPCVAGDTIVSTERGLIGIQNVPNAMRTARKLVYLLRTTEGYQVKVTRDHRVLTPTGWRMAGGLQQGNTVCLQSVKGGFGVDGDMATGQVLGWYVRDGWVLDDEEHATLAFYGKDRTELVRHYEQTVAQLTGSSPSLVEARNHCEVISRGTLELARDWGVTRTSVSERLLSSSEDCQRGFLQGLFTAGGSVQRDTGTGPCIRLSGKEVGLLQAVQLMLLNFGVVSSIRHLDRERGLRLTPDGRGGLRLCQSEEDTELVISGDNMVRFHEQIGFLLDFKQEALKDCMALLPPGQPSTETFLAHFESLVPLQEQDVFDVVGTPAGGFIAGGIVVHNCGEQPLLPYESCVLGSINLAKMVQDGKVNWKRLEEVVNLAIRFLDNIIDLNRYPVEDIEIATKATRKVGLGVMGFAEMLIQLGIPYDSDEGIRVAEEVMAFIRDRADKASQELAKVRGNFAGIDRLKTPVKWKRNATTTTIAPTGSISLIAQTSSGIEPLFAVAHSRILTEGIQLNETNELFRRIAEERGFWTDDVEREVARTGSVQHIDAVPDDVKRIFRTAHEIDPVWHLRMQAAFQRHTDNAVSKTVNLPRDATPDDVRAIFLLADELRLKGITVFRDGCLEGVQVLYLGCPTCNV
ncbi:MAG: ribonucleoside reductase class II [Candidatus Thorarchaeota archaeon]|nr:ribonucleoside reductase class II [Candidatus Thorarchaeota archaeon]